jgi:hypothetical protein
MPQYPGDAIVRDARDAYFSRSGFAPDGGYGDRWVKLKAGGRTVFAFPNTAARVRSVRLHDIHHVLTEYDTTWAGEAEIGAWELASGCGRHYPAWVLNFAAVAIGAFLWPRRVWAAFRRGRRSGNLYGIDFSEELLDQTVGDLRQAIGLAPLEREHGDDR